MSNDITKPLKTRLINIGHSNEQMNIPDKNLVLSSMNLKECNRCPHKHSLLLSIILMILLPLMASATDVNKSFTWPDTPASKVYQEFIHAYESGSKSEMEAFVRTNYKYTEQLKITQKTENWMDIYHRFGPVTVKLISIDKPNDLEIWLQGTVTKVWFAVEFMINEDSNKIRAVGMLLGEQPSNKTTPSESFDDFLERLNVYLDSNQDKGLFQGTVMMQRMGEIVFQKAYGYKNIEKKEKNQINTRMRLISITKPITAIAILQLVQKGLIDIHSPISEYLVELPEHISKKMTVYQLLTHTSGYELDGITGFRKEMEKTQSMGEVYSSQLKYLPMWEKYNDFELSTKWDYSNDSYDLLAIIIEKLSGQSFPEYLEKNIFSVAGMKDTSFIDKNIALPYRYDLNYGDLMDHSHYPRSFGAVSGAAEIKSTVRDLTMLFNTLFKTNKLLDLPHKSLLYAPLVKIGGGNFQGLGLKIMNDLNLNIGHGGVNIGSSAQIKYFPKFDLLLVVLCNNRSGASNFYDFVNNNLPQN